ncbi:MAG TPA: UBP-type zinc finger domain-containing protein [Myxococcales bacterium]
MDELCPHLKTLEDPGRAPVKPSGHGCKECLEIGDEWVHLRLCMSCGHVGCCDSSPNTHATKHFHQTQHPTVRSYEPGEDWAYCYPDDLTIDGLAALPGESASRHYSAPRARRS